MCVVMIYKNWYKRTRHRRLFNVLYLIKVHVACGTQTPEEYGTHIIFYQHDVAAIITIKGEMIKTNAMNEIEMRIFHSGSAKCVNIWACRPVRSPTFERWAHSSALFFVIVRRTRSVWMWTMGHFHEIIGTEPYSSTHSCRIKLLIELKRATPAIFEMSEQKKIIEFLTVFL